MRVAVVADIGQPVYHVGDEAIGHAVRDALRARGVRPVMLTRNIRHTQHYFGPVDAAPTLAFPWAPAARERYLEAITAVLDGDAGALPAGDPAFAFIDTLRGVDALLVAGGGNLNTPYGWLLYERLAAMVVARRLGKPVVVTGQTVGPTLSGHDAEVLGDALRGAALVSVREHHSVALARSLAPGHPAIVGGLDDAAAWRLDAPTPVAAEGDPRIVATFAPGTGPLAREDAVRALAALLDRVATHAGARVDLLPHMAHPGGADGDLGFHAEVVAASTSGRVVELPLPTAEQGADAVLGADLVVTSRYHPVVFAATRGVPVLALVPDRYADVRIDGALTHHGLEGWAVPMTALTTSEAATAAEAVWDDRGRVADHLRSTVGCLLAAHTRRWDEIVTALSGRSFAASDWQPAPALAPPDAVSGARAAHLPTLEAVAARAREAVEEERRLSLAAAGS